jgi:hypothetical protein
MNKIDELCAISPAELQTLSQQPSFKKVNSALLINLDETLVLTTQDNSGQQSKSQCLVGGDTTKALLTVLHQRGVVLCIATKNTKADGEAAIALLKSFGIADFFRFVIYDNAKSHKQHIFSACRKAFESVFFIDNYGDFSLAHATAAHSNFIKFFTVNISANKSPEYNVGELILAFGAAHLYYFETPITQELPAEVQAELSSRQSAEVEVKNKLRLPLTLHRDSHPLSSDGQEEPVMERASVLVEKLTLMQPFPLSAKLRQVAAAVDESSEGFGRRTPELQQTEEELEANPEELFTPPLLRRY